MLPYTVVNVSKHSHPTLLIFLVIKYYTFYLYINKVQISGHLFSSRPVTYCSKHFTGPPILPLLKDIFLLQDILIPSGARVFKRIFFNGVIWCYAMYFEIGNALICPWLDTLRVNIQQKKTTLQDKLIYSFFLSLSREQMQ